MNSLDPYTLAGREVLDGQVEPGAWARALVEGRGREDRVRAAYVRLRVAALERAIGLVRAAGELARERERLSAIERDVETCEAALGAYGERQLRVLDAALKKGDLETLADIRATICRKSGRVPAEGDPVEFLRIFRHALAARMQRAE